MNDFIHEIENIAEQYGLQITGLDVTDVTLMARMEVMPSIFIQIYRNVKKNKLNMALVSSRPSSIPPGSAADLHNMFRGNPFSSAPRLNYG